MEQSYVVRIYRQDRRRQELVGVVEEVGADGKQAFNTLEELWRILTSGKESSRGEGVTPGVSPRIADLDEGRVEQT